MDAALKNATHLLRDVMDAVDSNGDGKIQYQGMRTRTRSGVVAGQG